MTLPKPKKLRRASVAVASVNSTAPCLASDCSPSLSFPETPPWHSSHTIPTLVKQQWAGGLLENLQSIAPVLSLRGLPIAVGSGSSLSLSEMLTAQMIQRWRAELLQFHFIIKHRTAAMLTECDALSRYNAATADWHRLSEAADKQSTGCVLLTVPQGRALFPPVLETPQPAPPSVHFLPPIFAMQSREHVVSP